MLTLCSPRAAIPRASIRRGHPGPGRQRWWAAAGESSSQRQCFFALMLTCRGAGIALAAPGRVAGSGPCQPSGSGQCQPATCWSCQCQCAVARARWPNLRLLTDRDTGKYFELHTDNANLRRRRYISHGHHQCAGSEPTGSSHRIPAPCRAT